MPDPSDLAITVLQPVLAGTAFTDPQGRGSSVLWCVGTREFRRRHPAVTEAVDRDHPDGCTDLGVYADEQGLLEHAEIEMLRIDDGLVGLPIEDALPMLAERIGRLLG